MESEKNQGNTTNLIGAGIEARMSVTGSSITSAYFLQKNAHGDVTAAISGTERIATYDYDAFGNTLVEEGEINNPIRYSGEYLDEESGLIYLRARYYDPSVGRFISEDTHWNPTNMIYGDKEYEEGETKIPNIASILQSSNLYAYCMNNPVMYKDPSGLDVYYFVDANDSEFVRNAYYDKKGLEDKYGEPVYIIEVSSTDQFRAEWNKMGSWAGKDVNVSCVVIALHGTSISNAVGNTELYYDSRFISKNIGTILLMGCNSGHFDHRYTSFANDILQGNNVCSVIASDGTVKYFTNPFTKQTTYWIASDKQFKNELAPGYTRDALGYIKYTINEKGELVWGFAGTGNFVGAAGILNAAGV